MLVARDCGGRLLLLVLLGETGRRVRGELEVELARRLVLLELLELDLVLVVLRVLVCA